MAHKRKSDVIELTDSEDEPVVSAKAAKQHAVPALRAAGPSTKKARVSDARVSDVSGGSSNGNVAPQQTNWEDITLPGEADGNVPIYDDCAEIRRKIRVLTQEPGFKARITHWLKEIGNVNNNSYQRFMKAPGACGGASNGTYPAAYAYFEKCRIAEGKPKSAKRLRNEEEHPYGFELRDRRHVWVRTSR